MATEEHQELAKIIKEVHESLRKRCKLIGAEEAWAEHLCNENNLKEYSDAMSRLALIWENNASDSDNVRSRVKWTIDYCNSYFFTERIYLEKRSKEERLCNTWSDLDQSQCKYMEDLPTKIRFLDVGSCFNPFGQVPYFDVISLDLCPANKNVFRGDFLKIEISDEIILDHSCEQTEIKTLSRNYFHCIVFSLLLEYIPSSMQRLKCCQKALDLLIPEGILIIITPDSQHVGKNAALMKTWQYTLATLGFLRIKFKKLAHITCMAFRKPIHCQLAYRWAELHRADYMDVAIEIPQDGKI